jgi:DNA-binding SARP family transcriptional activator
VEAAISVGATGFGILGELVVYDADRALQLGPYKQRLVLGLLLCRAGQVVTASALSEAIWDDDPPRSAHKNVQGYVSALRKVLGSRAEIVHGAAGYALRIDPAQLDALRFRELARSGRLALLRKDTAAAAEQFGAALRMWRGPALAELTTIPAIAAEAEQLNDRFLAVYESWAEAMLAIGRHVDLLDGIDEQVRRHPLRERVRHAHMLALYRAGRQSEALAQFDSMRQLLARELGLQPSPVLARLYESILVGDPVLDQQAPVRISPCPDGTPEERAVLPRDLADFTGRLPPTVAVLDILRAAGDGTVVAINGAAGVGKTSLAVRCAHQLGDRFPDGRVFVRLRTSDGRPRPVPDVLSDLSRGFATPVGPDADTPPHAALLRATTGRRTLVVLDDAIAEAQVREVLSAIGGSTAIVTSRRHLGGLEGASHVALEPMASAEATEFLGRLIGAERLDAEPEAAVRLVARCCGLPLALRIAGSRLIAQHRLALSRFADRLDDDRRVLWELVVGDLQVRSRLDVSYRDLEAEDRAVLRAIATLGKPAFRAADLAAVLRIGTDLAEVAIERLVEARLVESRIPDVETHGADRPVRYTLPALTRTFVLNVSRIRPAGAAPPVPLAAGRS